MWETAVIVTVIISALGAALTALSCVLGRPIAMLCDRCLRRRGWLPADVEGQTPSDPNCQGKSNVAEGGSNQGPTEEPTASVVGMSVTGAVKPLVKGQRRVGPPPHYETSWWNSFPPSVASGQRSP